jgi:anti-sigma regulatory factor (Ser/Thr protein kinase)
VKVYLPNSAFLGNFEAFVRSFDPSDASSLRISANKKWISVHPAVLAMVAALGLTVEPSRIDCDPFEAKSAHYFERMGLFRSLRIESGITINERDPTGRFIPLTQIKDSNSLSRFITDMIPLLHLRPDHAEPIKYVVSELVRNVLEHSGCEHGATVAAQYYKKSNAIRIGIADTGVGVRKAITHSHPATGDLAALKLALTPGITGTTRKEGGTDYNAGAGLFFTKSIAMVNRDFFVLYSGSALYKLLKSTATKSLRLHADPFGDRHTKLDDLPPWPGTVVGIDMILDANEAFSDLLDRIRETYSAAIRARRANVHRRPRFT